MADYVANLTGSVEVDNSLLETMAQQILISSHEAQTLEPYVSHAQYIEGKSQGITKYGTLSINEEPLKEREEVDSKKLTDGKVLLVPKEYGDVVTTTALASLQTGGKVDRAAAQLVGINAGQSQTRHAMIALDKTANILLPAGVSSAATVSQADILTGAIANKAYNSLSRENVIFLDQVSQAYIAVAHEDILNDIRKEKDFVDVQKYANAEKILKNEIGFFKGFRWVRNNLTTKTEAVPGSGIFVYNTYFMGFNALGKDTSVDPHMRITGPFDKLARFVNVGWYGVYDYGIVDEKAIFVAKTAASRNEVEAIEEDEE